MELTGKPVSRGIAVGKVLRYEPFVPVLTQAQLTPQEIPQALEAYRQTRERARQELAAREEAVKARDPDKAQIMTAHMDILMDPAMEEDVLAMVEQGISPDGAVAQVYDMYADVLAQSQNPMMRERASDLKDVKSRFLRCWAGVAEKSLSELSEPVIVAADDLYPSDTVSLDREKVLGIITQVGGSTSHTAIIARSYEIPAVLGVPGAMDALSDGEQIILDAVEGKVITAPTGEELAAYAAAQKREQARALEMKRYLDAQPVTRDGARLEICLNVGANAQELTGAAHVDGCGLFRTEFLFLNSDHLPDEEEQYQAYSKVVRAFAGKPVTLRTMDIGGDKQLPLLHIPKEENPFLGLRGVRLSLEREELFRTQLRAALRASAEGKLKVMFPMVGGLDEIRRAKALIAQEAAKLDAAGIPRDREMEVGVMVEVPSVALIADLVVDEVDFVSVGTNDLTQYLCAADRMNQGVKAYYQEYHPAVFRVLGYLAKTFGQAGKTVSVCGELGGDPLAAPVLAGLGIRKLSMGIASVPAVKRVIQELELAEGQALAEEVQKLGTDGEIRARLEAFSNR